MNEAKFYLITDTHFFDTDLGCSGAEYDDFMHYEQKCFAETESINNSVFAWLKDAKDADTLLIAGDLSFNGERKSHEKFLKLLYDLKESGKKIYVVTADHDWKNEGETFAFDENGRYSPEHTNRDELFKMYRDFGFGDAIETDRKHLSYVAQISEGVRLLAINCDAKDGGQHYFDDSQLSWIKHQAQKARKDGQTMFAMCHYPILGGQPIFSLIKPMMIKNWDKFADLLADEGINLIFTGHMHNQSINLKISEKGNKLYDVCTGAIIADPAFIRLVHLKGDEADIKSIPTPDFDFDTKGKDCKTYLKYMFDQMIVNVLTDLRDDTTRAMGKFHIKEDKKTVTLLHNVGKFVCKVKIGTMARLLMLKCDKSIKNMRLFDYATNLTRNIFRGNQPYVEGTPEGDVFIALLKRLRPLFKKLDLKDTAGNKADLYEMLKNTAGNYDTDDYNAVLKLK